MAQWNHTFCYFHFKLEKKQAEIQEKIEDQ